MYVETRGGAHSCSSNGLYPRRLNHFGGQEHNYCHWLDNVPPVGQHQLWKVLLHNPNMANPHKRDASALRLLSWLSFSLDRQTSALLAKLMKQLTTEEETSPTILQIVQESDVGASWNSLAEIRAGLIDQISISNLAHPTDVVTQLYRTFLTRLSFPRLVHFLDLVLPQMQPHQRIRDHNDIRQLTSHYLSLHGQDGGGLSPPLIMNFLFHSHAGLVHVLVEWFRHPLLVFSDYPKVERAPLDVLRSASTLETYRQHVAFGIRSGQSTLFAFESRGNLYKMVGILITSNVPQKASNENRHWKHVAPYQTELAILPQAMAETFCRHALEGHPNYHYLQDWGRMFSPTEGGRVQITMHHIELLGDTRSADDLGVFCTMPPERLSIGCGLLNSERPEGSHPNQKALLRDAAIKLLCTILEPEQNDRDDEEVSAYNFFSIAARTITALTVMRSGRTLRHLDIVGSHLKQKQTQKHKPNTKNQPTPTKRLPKKARTRVKRCETCENATLKLSNVLLQEVVPNTFRCSFQRCSVSNHLPCIYHTSRSIFEKVASSRSGLLSSI